MFNIVATKHVHLYTCICMECVYVCMCVCKYVSMSVCKYVCLCLYMNSRTYVCIRWLIELHIRLIIYVRIYMHTQFIYTDIFCIHRCDYTRTYIHIFYTELMALVEIELESSSRRLPQRPPGGLVPKKKEDEAMQQLCSVRPTIIHLTRQIPHAACSASSEIPEKMRLI